MSADQGDSFAFECDLDRHIPSHERAAVLVEDMGDHVAVAYSPAAGTMPLRVFLTPEAAREMAVILRALAGDEDALDEPEEAVDEPEEVAEPPAEPARGPGTLRQVMALLAALTPLLWLTALTVAVLC